MIKFILKAVLRDKRRSLLPIVIISIGVFLTVALSGYLKGVLGDMINQTARFDTGHVKIMSKPYADNKDQMPNDLALVGVSEISRSLRKNHPNYRWVNRIRFGGLIDAPNSMGESKRQGPASALAIDLLSLDSEEVDRLNIKNSLVRGDLPCKSKEILIGDEFAKKMSLNIGDEITYMGTTMNYSLTFDTFIIAGTLSFGVAAMDKGMMIVDIRDAQRVLDMENAAGEILGFSKDEVYYDEDAEKLAIDFNAEYADSQDEFAPVMLRLKEQNNMGSYLDYVNSFSSIFVLIFIIVMSIVLWNTGLLAGLRRYKEFGIRLALGEEKGHIYKSLIVEATIIGIIGSIVGTILGVLFTFYLQYTGIDISDMTKGATMMMSTVLRSKFTPELLYIGFIPGVFAMVFGNMLSGYGIYKRETATLFKDLEV